MKKIYIAMIVAGIILILTNPTPSDFESHALYYSGYDKKYHNKFSSPRIRYFLFFSVYEYEYYLDYSSKRYSKQYIGVLKNFLPI